MPCGLSAQDTPLAPARRASLVWCDLFFARRCRQSRRWLEHALSARCWAGTSVGSGTTMSRYKCVWRGRPFAPHCRKSASGSILPACGAVYVRLPDCYSVPRTRICILSGVQAIAHGWLMAGLVRSDPQLPCLAAKEDHPARMFRRRLERVTDSDLSACNRSPIQLGAVR